MTVLKLEERERAGRLFGDWLRAELRAVGDACKCTNWFSLSDGEAYVALKDDLDEVPRNDKPFVLRRVIPVLDGRERVATLTDVEPNLYDGDRDLAIVYHAHRAVLVSAPLLIVGIACAHGDVYVGLPAARVRKSVEQAKHEGRGGDERGRNGRGGGDDD